MRVLFFGTAALAVPSLQKLHADGFEIIGVVTQPDKPVGRKQKLTPSPVKKAAQELGIPVFEPTTLKDEAAQKTLSELKPDVIVVVAYGKIIPPWLLELPKLGAINVHPSLLPKYRGASPLPASIVHGDTETGVTIMLMDEELDHGPILSQEKIALTGTETGETISKQLAEHGATQLSKTLKDFVDGNITPKEQDHGAATYTEILTRDHGKIDWTKSAVEIERMIRAYTPWPGAWTTLDGKRLKVMVTRIYDGKNMDVCGTIWKTENGELAGATKTSGLVLVTVQPEGGTVMTGEDFARGNFKK